MNDRSCVMLDRDGTIIVERHYLSHPDQVELLPGAGESLKILQDSGMKIVILTNQSGIARGFFDLQQLERIHQRLKELLLPFSVQLDGIFFCPHLPTDKCSCRKPKTGLVEQAIEQVGFNPNISFMIGDKWCDIEMGRRVGAKTFLVLTGHGKEELKSGKIKADYVVDNLTEASNIIIS
ncbi:MAG: HAD family hydrolase [Cyanobacteria bacterium SBLK]|nr:HAD family hydrolase [Cyanobacteria bacterium SBLK]